MAESAIEWHMSKQRTMNVSLTPELAKGVAARVKKGEYQSASEVVRAALTALDERERDRRAAIARLRKMVDAGLRAYERGDHRPAVKTLEDLRGQLRRRRRNRAA